MLNSFKRQYGACHPPAHASRLRPDDHVISQKAWMGVESMKIPGFADQFYKRTEMGAIARDDLIRLIPLLPKNSGGDPLVAGAESKANSATICSTELDVEKDLRVFSLSPRDGGPVVYSVVFQDLEAVRKELCLLGTVVIRQNTGSIDRGALLLQLWESEFLFQQAKWNLVSTLMRAYDHAITQDLHKEYQARIIRLIHLRPSLDVEKNDQQYSPYFTIGYQAHIDSLVAEERLLRCVFEHRSARELNSNSPTDRPAWQMFLTSAEYGSSRADESVKTHQIDELMHFPVPLMPSFLWLQNGSDEERSSKLEQQDFRLESLGTVEDNCPDTSKKATNKDVLNGHKTALPQENVASGLLQFAPCASRSVLEVWDTISNVANKLGQSQFHACCRRWHVHALRRAVIERAEAAFWELEHEEHPKDVDATSAKLAPLLPSILAESPQAEVLEALHRITFDQQMQWNTERNHFQLQAWCDLAEAVQLRTSLLQLSYESALLSDLYGRQAAIARMAPHRAASLLPPRALQLNEEQPLWSKSARPRPPAKRRQFELAAVEIEPLLPLPLPCVGQATSYMTIGRLENQQVNRAAWLNLMRRVIQAEAAQRNALGLAVSFHIALTCMTPFEESVSGGDVQPVQTTSSSSWALPPDMSRLTQKLLEIGHSVSPLESLESEPPSKANTVDTVIVPEKLEPDWWRICHLLSRKIRRPHRSTIKPDSRRIEDTHALKKKRKKNDSIWMQVFFSIHAKKNLQKYLGPGEADPQTLSNGAFIHQGRLTRNNFLDLVALKRRIFQDGLNKLSSLTEGNKGKSTVRQKLSKIFHEIMSNWMQKLSGDMFCCICSFFFICFNKNLLYSAACSYVLESYQVV